MKGFCRGPSEAGMKVAGDREAAATCIESQPMQGTLPAFVLNLGLPNGTYDLHHGPEHTLVSFYDEQVSQTHDIFMIVSMLVDQLR
eukprot:SAG31_NODE_525_length_14489_cov_3.693815_16_plen_86_part_00